MKHLFCFVSVGSRWPITVPWLPTSCWARSASVPLRIKQRMCLLLVFFLAAPVMLPRSGNKPFGKGQEGRLLLSCLCWMSTVRWAPCVSWDQCYENEFTQVWLFWSRVTPGHWPFPSWKPASVWSDLYSNILNLTFTLCILPVLRGEALFPKKAFHPWKYIK